MKKQIFSAFAVSVVLLLMSSIFNSCIQEETFTKATVETSQVTSVTEATAISGGVVTSDGGSNISVRGVCWNTSPYPTIENDTTTEVVGTGPFTSLIKGLSPSTTYYVRAYAINKGGTSYGLQMTFTTKTFSITTTPIAISLVTATSAIGGGNIISDGDSSTLTVKLRGVCWNTFPSPTIENSKTMDGVGGGRFTSKIDSLTAFTTYYARAYATNGNGTIYGNEVTFTTQSGMVGLATTATSAIMAYTATSGGTISSDGGAAVTARGVCWNTSSAPTIDNLKTANGSGTGTFTSSITGLTLGTTYYVRSYATNSVGTSYGNEVVFTTPNGVVELTTDEVSSITTYTATSGGTITSDGGLAVTARGFCWSTSQNPTTANSITTVGTGLGSFSAKITGLAANTIYYVRAYATNSLGTSYGIEKSFTTLNLVVNTTNLVAYFPFDGNAKESITNLMPSNQPNVTYVNGQKGKAYQGANGAYLRYILPSISKLKTLKSFTVAMWFKSPLVTGDPEPIILQIGKSDDLYWGNMTLGLNRLSATADSLQMKAFFLKSGAEWSGQNISYSNTMFKVNQWMHLVFEYNGATSKYIIFKNGVKVVTSLGVEDRKANSAGDALGNLNFVNADVFNIGSWRPKSEGTATDAWMGWFLGNIDELRIYEKALSEIEVKDLYDAEESLTN